MNRIGEVWCHLQMARTKDKNDNPMTLLCTDLIVDGPIRGRDIGGAYTAFAEWLFYYRVLRMYPSHPSKIYYEPIDQFMESPWKKQLA